MGHELLVAGARDLVAEVVVQESDLHPLSGLRLEGLEQPLPERVVPKDVVLEVDVALRGIDRLEQGLEHRVPIRVDLDVITGGQRCPAVREEQSGEVRKCEKVPEILLRLIADAELEALADTTQDGLVAGRLGPEGSGLEVLEPEQEVEHEPDDRQRDDGKQPSRDALGIPALEEDQGDDRDDVEGENEPDDEEQQITRRTHPPVPSAPGRE